MRISTTLPRRYHFFDSTIIGKRLKNLDDQKTKCPYEASATVYEVFKAIIRSLNQIFYET